MVIGTQEKAQVLSTAIVPFNKSCCYINTHPQHKQQTKRLRIIDCKFRPPPPLPPQPSF